AAPRRRDLRRKARARRRDARADVEDRRERLANAPLSRARAARARPARRRAPGDQRCGLDPRAPERARERRRQGHAAPQSNSKDRRALRAAERAARRPGRARRAQASRIAAIRKKPLTPTPLPLRGRGALAWSRIGSLMVKRSSLNPL